MERVVNSTIDSYLKKLDNLKDGHKESNFALDAEDLNNLMDRVITEIKDESQERFKERMEHVHSLLTSLKSDLE